MLMKTFRKRVIALLMVICVLLGSFPLQLSLQASAVGGIDSLTCSSFISTASHRQYIDTMMRYYLNNNSKLRTALDNGKNVIFMFEGGSDNYPSYSYSTSSSSNRNQAVCIVIKKNSSGNAYIAFYCENCSSVPCKPKNTGGGAYDGSTTLMDGIYGVYTTSHFGYGALQTTASTGYYTPPSSPNGWVNSANGINVHTRTTNNPVGWSAGCQVIGTSAYSDNPFNQFMKVVTGITYNVWYDYYNGGINGPPSQGVDMGYYVVDRQLGWDGLLNLYNTTALTNITAYSTSAKKAGMNYYYFKCTSYPSYCQIKINSSTSVMSQPCTASTDSSSKVLSTAAANSTYTATKLYKNTAGQLWYEVQLSGGEIGHIPAASTTYVKQLTSDIKISSAGIPSGHVKGDSFIVSGNITSSYNQLSTVSAYIYNGVSTTGTPATGAQATVNGTAYNLAGSTIDNNTLFGAIDVGTYTYVISANYINYYATSGTAMSSNTGKIELVNEYFAVIAAKADQSTCSHTYKDNVLQAATCTATGKSVQVCSTCGKVNKVTTAAAGHSFSAWKDTIVATCVTDGLQTRTCSACGKVESKTVTAGGHTYTTKTVAATCIKHEHTVNTCSGCGDSYITYDDSLYTSWKTYLPDGVDADLVDTKIQSRYRDLESVTSTATSMDGYTLTSTDWVKNATGTIKYVKEWPSGFDTSNSLYSTYNKTPKSASETASAKTTVSEKQIGYLYYHWCYGTYTTGPINRSSRAEKEGEFTSFAAFFSNAEPERVYEDDETTCWQMTNADACTDSYWYWRVPVYEQTYTSYKKQNVFTRWGDWSPWKTTTYTASATREVETRTVYRMIPAEYGDHTYVNGFCTICGEEQPAFVCEHEKHTTAGVCVTCSATVEHTYENGCCTICGAVCSHSFVSGVCSICGMTKETSTTLSTYLTNCTAYASHLIVKTTAATSLMTYPCTKAVQSNSSLNAKVAADTTLFVKQLYKNTVGEYWYKVVRYGKTCYVKADDTTLVEHLTGDVTATGISSPASLSYKAGFPIAGTVSSSANLLTTVTGAVHYGADITKVPAISSSDTATNNTYNLASSTIDNNLIFSNLAPGTYTYQITANAKSYYIKDDGTVGSSTKLVDLHRKNMVITDVNNPNKPTGFGIDVSEWNGTINWAKVAKEVDFVILRASWEETADQTFITNANACVANGIPFGVYVYSYAENKAEAVGEAEYVLSLVKNYDLALPIWFDMEDPVHSALSSSMKQEVVRGFCDTITEGGYQPGLYTFISWFNSYFTDSYYKTLPHWVAQIDGFTSNGTSSYTGGTHMWQYSWVGSISGISGDVDCNYYYAEFDGGSADTSYPTKCTKYPSYLNVTTNGAVEMRKYPCTASVNSGSTLVTTIADATKIVVTGLYKNTNNELWYQVKYNSKNGYVPASSVKFHSFRYDDVVAIDPTMASNIAVGGAYNITGDLTSAYNEMITPFAKVYKNEDLLATQVLTSSENVTTKHYRIDGSTVDAKLYFGSLSEGYYTYELGANVKNYYCKSDGTISSKTESVTTWVQPFTVGSSTISHSHTTATQAAVAATCTTTGLTAGAYCTTCGEITTEQTPVAALGHTAGAPVQENVVENVSYEEVIYCSTCDVQLSRKFVQLQVCEHEKHNQSGACTECGDTVEHTFSNGACTVCGLPCDHVWSGCTCTICGLTVTPGAMSDVTLSGSFNNWATTPNMSIVNGNEVTVTLDLTAGSHTFKVLMDSLTYGNSGTIANSTTGLTMIQNAANTTLQLTYDGTYAFKFNTDTKVISVTAVSVKVPGKLTVDVSGGNGFSITIENGTAKPQGNFYYNSKIDMGTLVQVTAKEIADTTFLGWMDMKTKKIVSTTMSYKFYTSGNDHFSAVYMQEAENANWVVFINDRTNQVMEMQYYAPTDSILFPSSPSSSNHAFNGWQYTEAEIQAKLAKGENVVVNGVWEIIETYVSVSVKNGTITQAANMNDDGKVLANSAVIVTANAAPSGKKFAYWRTSDGTVKSYDTVYRFYPSGNMTLTAVYVLESATVDYTPLVSIDYVDTTTNLTKNSFHISWDVPEEEAGLTYIAAGIVAVNKAYYKEETLVVGSTDTNVYDRRPTTTSNTASNSFVWTKSNVAPGDVWVAKAYVQYKDSNGKLYTIYTDLVEVVKG